MSIRSKNFWILGLKSSFGFPSNNKSATIVNIKTENLNFIREGKFQGKNRGVFNIPIEAQKLKITEEEFDKFVRKTYGNDISVSFFTLVSDYKLDVSDEFSIAQFTEITSMQEMNKEGTIIEIKFRRAPRVALAKIDNEYKIGIFPESPVSPSEFMAGRCPILSIRGLA